MRRLPHAALLAAVLAAGCAAPPAPPASVRPAPTIVAQVGGTVRCVALARHRVYRAVGGAIEVASLDDLSARGRVSLAVDARVADLRVHAGDLYAVVVDRAVVRLLLADPDAPAVDAVWTADALGVAPRRLAILDGAVVALGDRAVVGLDGSSIAARDDMEIASIVSNGSTLAVVGTRRIVDVRSGALLGSADEVHATDGGDAVPAPFIFLRHGTVESFGLLDADFRETDHERCSIERTERVEGIRLAGGRLWSWTAHAATAFIVHDRALRAVQRIDRAGILDVAAAESGDVVVVGGFGTEMHPADGGAPRRSPALGSIEAAHGDGRTLLVRAADGSFRLDEVGRIAVHDDLVPGGTLPAALATVHARLEIESDGRVRVEAAARPPLDLALRAPIGAASAVAGDFWIADATELIVVSGRAADAGRVLARVPLPGPAVAIVPRLDGRAWIAMRDDGVLLVDPRGAAAAQSARASLQ